MSSKRTSSCGHPLEEEEEIAQKQSTFLVKKPSRTKVTEEQGGPVVADLQKDGLRKSSY